jgi:hypothetical protein
MNGPVGTVDAHLKFEWEGLASDNLLAAGSRKRSTVAGEVTATGVERVLRRRALDGHRLGDEQMSISHAQERGSHDGGAAEGGDGVEVVHVCDVRLVRTGSEFSECGAFAGS